MGKVAPLSGSTENCYFINLTHQAQGSLCSKFMTAPHFTHIAVALHSHHNNTSHSSLTSKQSFAFFTTLRTPCPIVLEIVSNFHLDLVSLLGFLGVEGKVFPWCGRQKYSILKKQSAFFIHQ